VKPKNMILLVVAVGCGLAASYLTSQLLANREKAVATVKVLVAKKRIPSFTAIKDPEAMFAEKEFPETLAPKKAVTNFADVKDKRTNKLLSEDNVLLIDDLADAKTEGMSATMGPGERAVSIKVNAEKSVAGFVLPGSRVDVIATINSETGSKESKIILQNMLVMAVDNKDRRETDGPSSIVGQTVTLSAKPEEAQRLFVAQALGELSLILRPLGDREVLHIKPTRANDLNRPLTESTDAKEEEAAPVRTAAAPVPQLPPVVQQAEVKPEEKPEEKTAIPETPKKVYETHTIVIQSGENQQKAIFTREQGEKTWKNGQIGRVPDEVLQSEGSTPKLGSNSDSPVETKLAPQGPARAPAVKKQ
jgi:pilus assembly protein CpaB